MLPDKIRDIGWFDAGWAVFKGTTDPDFHPLLNDMQAQREWLDGFGAARAEYPDSATIAELVAGERGDDRGETLDEALICALEGRADLLRQLRSHGTGRSSRTVHCRVKLNPDPWDRTGSREIG